MTESESYDEITLSKLQLITAISTIKQGEDYNSDHNMSLAELQANSREAGDAGLDSDGKMNIDDDKDSVTDTPYKPIFRFDFNNYL